jgi:hypothetical protein
MSHYAGDSCPGGHWSEPIGIAEIIGIVDAGASLTNEQARGYMRAMRARDEHYVRQLAQETLRSSALQRQLDEAVDKINEATRRIQNLGDICTSTAQVYSRPEGVGGE